MLITSLTNEKVKKYVKLNQSKKYRDEEGLFLVEGMHLVLEAYKKDMIVEVILEQDYTLPLDVPKVYVTKEILSKISDCPSPQEVMALCKKKIVDIKGNKLLLLDGLQDPGNLGTIIRSATAFGVDTICLSEDSVDLYNPKVIRATQGMLFHIPIVRTNLEKMIVPYQQKGYPLYVTQVSYGKDARDLTKEERQKYMLCMGNEGNGVRPEIIEMADSYLSIPMQEEVESLNVAVATSILLYELGREK